MSLVSRRVTNHHNAAEAVSRADVLERIGRNLLFFQLAERRVKVLASRRRVSGMSDEFGSKVEKLREQVAGETLGTVVRRAVDSSDRSAREQAGIEAAVLESGGIHLEFDCNFTGADGEPDAGWQQRLEALVEERNELVHHFIERFDLETDDGRREAALHLDQQHARHESVVDELGRRCAGLAEASKEFAAALQRDDVRAEILHGHLRCRLEEALQRVAAEKTRDDGWTPLSLVGQELAEAHPDLLERLAEAFGHHGLKQAVASLAGWELREEPTKGGIRLLYRCSL